MSEVIETREVEIPDVTPVEQAALEAEQNALNAATAAAQIEHLTARVVELARENARLKEGKNK